MNLWHFWFPWLSQPSPKPAEPARGYATDEHDAAIRLDAYREGLIDGELRGRVMLAREIEAEFQGQPMTPADATRIRQRQVH